MLIYVLLVPKRRGEVWERRKNHFSFEKQGALYRNALWLFVPSDVQKFKNEYLAVNTLPLRQMFLPRVPAIIQAPRNGERDQW